MQPERKMLKKAARKTRTTTGKKASVKKRAATRSVATKERAPAKKRIAARRPSTAKTVSTALEMEELFETTQAKLVPMWEKELNAATQELEGLRKKLDRAVEKQRKLKDRRVAAATRLKQARSETARTRLEKAKLAYTETTAVVVELRSLMEAARARMKTAKLGLARAANRDKILARFAKNYDKTQEAKGKGTRRKTRKTTRRAARKAKAEPSVPGSSDSEIGDEGSRAMSPAAETVSPDEPEAVETRVAPLSSVG
jgi:hypothetical protein